MGTFNTTVEIGDPKGETFQPLQVMVGSGSAFSRVPREKLEGLGVPVERTVQFRNAVNRVVERPVGRTLIRLEGQQFLTPVIFGEEGETSLLGFVALEDAMLAVDPVGNRLVPVEGWLLGATLQQSQWNTSEGRKILDVPSDQPTLKSQAG